MGSFNNRLEMMKNAGDGDLRQIAIGTGIIANILMFLAVIPLVFFRHQFGARGLRKRQLFSGFLVLTLLSSATQSVLMGIFTALYLAMGIYHHIQIKKRREAGNPYKVPNYQPGYDHEFWFMLPWAMKWEWMVSLIYQPAFLLAVGYGLTFIDMAFGYLLMAQGGVFFMMMLAEMFDARERRMDQEDAQIEAEITATEMMQQYEETPVEKDSVIPAVSAVSDVERDIVKKPVSSAITREAIKTTETANPETA